MKIDFRYLLPLVFPIAGVIITRITFLLAGAEIESPAPLAVICSAIGMPTGVFVSAILLFEDFEIGSITIGSKGE